MFFVLDCAGTYLCCLCVWVQGWKNLTPARIVLRISGMRPMFSIPKVRKPLIPHDDPTATIQHWPVRTGACNFPQAYMFDWLASSQISAPILFIHPLSDTVVPNHLVPVAASLSNHPGTRIVHSAHGHFHTYTQGFKAAGEAMASFLIEYLHSNGDNLAQSG